jgi:hypothetical protein
MAGGKTASGRPSFNLIDLKYCEETQRTDTKLLYTPAGTSSKHGTVRPSAALYKNASFFAAATLSVFAFRVLDP